MTYVASTTQTFYTMKTKIVLNDQVFSQELQKFVAFHICYHYLMYQADQNCLL